MFLEILEDFLSRQVGWYLCGKENGGHRRTFFLLTLSTHFSLFSYGSKVVLLYFKNTALACRTLLQKSFPTRGQTLVSCVAGRFLTLFELQGWGDNI